MENKLSYFLRNFCLVYEADETIRSISIGYGEEFDIELVKAELIDYEVNSESVIWQEWKGTSIPFLTNSVEQENIIEKKENGIIIHYDIVNAGWYLMSGAQEIVTKQKDKYGRFTHEKSLQKKLGITELPVVNYYFDILKEAIEMATEIKLKTKGKFTSTLTHDIDEATSAWKHRIRLNLEKKNYLQALKQGVSHFINSFNPWKNLLELSNFNSYHGVKSTFFFLPRNNKVGEIKNADYSFSNPYIQHSIQEIAKNHEVGVHGSYKTHDSEEELNQDIQQFENKINGNRFHFLQFDMDKTPHILSKSKLMYDSSLGFQEHMGFRNSICTPFYLYDFENKTTLDVIEIPINIMDCSLEFKNYMNLSPNESFTKIKGLVKEIKKFNGNICINWHNTYFSNYLKSEWKNLYIEIIKYLKNEECEFLTCKELAERQA